MQQASLLYYSAKPQSGGILGCALRHCQQNHSIPDVLSKLAERTGAYSLYAWSGYRRSADVPRADHDIALVDRHGRVALRSEILCMPFFHLFDFSTSQNAAAFIFKHKKIIDVTDLFWPKTIRYRF